jgi:hypothetical protein
MRPLGRDTSTEPPPARTDRGASRGAWYRDPFGVADERWWNGTQWSREVRGPASADGDRRSPARPVRPQSLDGRGQGPRARSSNAARDDHFPVSIGAVVDERLSVVSSPRKPGAHCQVLASRGRAGSISVFGGQMARVACAHGAWVLKKSTKDARGLTIESADRKHAGGYLRRQWLPGGSIRLVDGTEVELRRSRPGRWKVQSADDRSCLAELRRSRRRSAHAHELKVTVHALPNDDATASMIVLAACAVLLLPSALD